MRKQNHEDIPVPFRKVTLDIWDMLKYPNTIGHVLYGHIFCCNLANSKCELQSFKSCKKLPPFPNSDIFYAYNADYYFCVNTYYTCPT